MKKKRKLGHQAEHEKGKFIRHFIFGAEDGLISTLGFLSGITGAGLSHFTIAIAGVAEVFAAALSMGIGTYLSSKSQTELIKRNIEIEKIHIEKYPQLEKKEVEDFYRKKGFKGIELKHIVNKICSNKKVLLKEMLTSELGIFPKRFENPLKSAVVMFISFIILAMIPLLPFILIGNSPLTYSIIFTLIVLFLVGATKTRLTKRNWFYSGLEMLVLGLVATIVTFYIGEFISTLY